MTDQVLDQGSLLLKKQLTGMRFLSVSNQLRLFSPDVRANANANSMASFCFTELNKKPTEGFSAGLIDDENLYKWELMVVGPADTF